MLNVLLYSVELINKWKVNKMKEKEQNVIYDDVTNYGITIINDVMYLIKDNKKMRLDALIIKEREEN